jgi:hypothetical protein
VCVLFLITTAWALPPDDEPWETIQDDPHTECALVETRLWCRAYGHAAAALAAVQAVIEDREDYPKFYPHVVEVRILDDHTHYTRIDMPAWLSDRDQVCAGDRQEGDGWAIYHWKAVERADTPDLGYVRLTDAEGQWKLTRSADGGTDLVYEWLAEMGGSLPNRLRWTAAKLHADEIVRGTIKVAESGDFRPLERLSDP